LPHAQQGGDVIRIGQQSKEHRLATSRGENSMIESPRIDVAAVINNSAISRFQYIIFVLCFLIIVCDGFDTQAIAYVAPSIVSEWKLTPASFGPVFAAVILGAMIGSFTFGRLADRFGRIRTLALCVIWFGILNIASAYATSIMPFTILRFLCGIGLGGAIPNVMALVAEYAPARKRSTAIASTWCGFALGAVLGGMISVPLIANFGWASVFVAGGILPFCLIPFVIFALPESIKFLIVAHDKTARVAAILRRIDPRQVFADTSVFVLDEPQPGRGQVSALFKDGLAAGSILLCLAFFLSLMLVYQFINWIPLLLREAGFPLRDALMGTVIFNFAGIIGSIFCTQLIDRKVAPPIGIIIAAYFAGAVAVFSIGYAGTSFAFNHECNLSKRVFRHRRTAFAERLHHQFLSNIDPRHRGRLVAGRRPIGIIDRTFGRRSIGCARDGTEPIISDQQHSPAPRLPSVPRIRQDLGAWRFMMRASDADDARRRKRDIVARRANTGLPGSVVAGDDGERGSAMTAD
jgi:MFS transporter, AAHS family, 4-hydroxybenzoate transporter